MTRDNAANEEALLRQGWYGYVDKDRGHSSAGPSPSGSRPTSARQGPGGVPRLLYAALDQTAAELEDELGNPNPDDWRANAAAERIFFARLPGHHDALDQPADVPAGDQLLGHR